MIDSNEAIEESLDKLQKEENIYKSIEKKGLENISETKWKQQRRDMACT